MINNKYDADSFEILEGLEAIRRDTSMYMNSTGKSGIMQMLIECVDNSVDESNELKGIRPVKVYIKIDEEGRVVVEDNGRGIPTGINKKYNKPAVYIAFEHIHGGGKIKGSTNKSYSSSIGVHGVGLACVNALSKELKITIKRDGKVYYVEYSKGKRIKDLEIIGECRPEETGTRIEFLYDDEIMKPVGFSGELEYPFDVGLLKEKINNYMLFNDNVEIELEYDTPEESGIYKPNREELTPMNLISTVAIEPQSITKLEISSDDPIYSLSGLLAVNEKDNIIAKTAVNGLYLQYGGSHIESIIRFLCEIVRERLSRGVLKPEYGLSDSEIKSFISYIIELRTPDPDFQGQVKNYFDNPSIAVSIYSRLKGQINQLSRGFIKRLTDKVAEYYEEKVRFQEELKKKKEKQKPRLTTEDILDFQENLFDCLSNSSKYTECWIVEGKSAATGIINQRDKNYIAVYRLQGKVINVAKNDTEKVKKNKQFRGLQALFEQRKYGKYIICTDADEDGKHIQLLIIKLVADWFPEIIDNGKLYIACPPLYRIESGKRRIYAYSEEEKEEILKTTKGTVQRFKGLGEMDENDIYEQLIVGSKLLKVVWTTRNKEFEISSKELLEAVMGSSIHLRKSVIMDNFADENIIDYTRRKRVLKQNQKVYLDPTDPLRYLDELSKLQYMADYGITEEQLSETEDVENEYDEFDDVVDF